MMEYKTLGEITSSKNSGQFYLTDTPKNVAAVERSLKAMGMGDRFEFVDKGTRALVISPAFDSEIVIRLSTEFEEPGFEQENPLTGRMEKVFRPQIPQVLQALHTEFVDVAPPTRAGVAIVKPPPTRMRIEILPRLKMPKIGDQRYGNILIRELRASGYSIHDAKEQNIGLLPRSGKPVLLDPGEVKWVGKSPIRAKLRSMGSFFSRTEWTFEEQTEHLKTNWKVYIDWHKQAALPVGAEAENSRVHRDRLSPVSGMARDI